MNENWEKLIEQLTLYGYIKFSRALKEQVRPLLESLANTRSPAVVQGLINELVSEVAMYSAMNDFVNVASARTSRVVSQMYGSIAGGFGSELFNRGVSEYMAEVGSQHVTEITETTRKLINKAFADATENGDTLRQLEKRIRTYTLGNNGESGLEGRINVKARALLIARTETQMAAGNAEWLRMQESPYVLEKTWIHQSGLKYPRDTHIDVNGTKRDFDKTWTLNGRKMLYAGHRSGGAINNCNCRCSVAYSAKKDADGNLIRKNL